MNRGRARQATFLGDQPWCAVVAAEGLISTVTIKTEEAAP